MGGSIAASTAVGDGGPPSQTEDLDISQALPSESHRSTDRGTDACDRLERRTEPDSGKTFTLEEFKVAFAGNYTGDEILEYWRDACIPVTELTSEGVGPNASTLAAPPAAVAELSTEAVLDENGPE